MSNVFIFQLPQILHSFLSLSSLQLHIIFFSLFTYLGFLQYISFRYCMFILLITLKDLSCQWRQVRAPCKRRWSSLKAFLLRRPFCGPTEMIGLLRSKSRGSKIAITFVGSPPWSPRVETKKCMIVVCQKCYLYRSVESLLEFIAFLVSLVLKFPRSRRHISDAPHIRERLLLCLATLVELSGTVSGLTGLKIYCLDQPYVRYYLIRDADDWSQELDWTRPTRFLNGSEKFRRLSTIHHSFRRTHQPPSKCNRLNEKCGNGALIYMYTRQSSLATDTSNTLVERTSRLWRYRASSIYPQKSPKGYRIRICTLRFVLLWPLRHNRHSPTIRSSASFVQLVGERVQ